MQVTLNIQTLANNPQPGGTEAVMCPNRVQAVLSGLLIVLCGKDFFEADGEFSSSKIHLRFQWRKRRLIAVSGKEEQLGVGLGAQELLDV
jgi:hypothetical protein